MKRKWVRLITLFLSFCCVAGMLSIPSLRRLARQAKPSATTSQQTYTIVLDAGHGGEDGGASSASGALEKEINLAITLALRDLLITNGIQVILTRSEDILLYDRTVDFKGRKKALDLAARRKIAEEAPNAVFVSIHMNAFPKSQYKGLQVWYSKNSPASFTLAESVQQLAKEKIQPENDRRVKPATSSIYLLHHLTCPAVLIECGFLSNPEEAALLSTAEYQNQLAFLLFLAITDGMMKISTEIATSS
jgi:N-acetylmuramoyl-L-alanine amidase